MTELLFLFLYAIIVWAVIEIAVLLFKMTGLEVEVARYQVISMLTGTGYTTEESALVIDHPVRRRISAGLILFGYFSLAVIISAIATLLSNDLRLNFLGISIAVLFVIYALLKTKAVANLLSRRFEHKMDEQFNLEDWPLKDALSLEDEDMVSMLSVEEYPQFENRRLCDLNLEEQNIQVLMVKRGGYILREYPMEEQLQKGDRIMVFGDKASIRQKFPEMQSREETKS